MYVTSTGPSEGEPLVFLHGAMVAGWMWQQQTHDLAQYRCVVPDLPGFDHSGDVPWTDLPDVADQVAALIRAEVPGGSAHVIGLSLGGLVTVHVAARHPDVLRTALVSGVPAGEFGWAQRAGNRLLGWLFGRPWGAGVVARSLGLPDEESRRAFVESAGRSDTGSLRRIADEISAGALPDLTGLQVPMLAVVGEKDAALTRRFVAELPTLAPSATGAVVPGVGHQWNAERPDLFSDLVRAWVSGRLSDVDLGRDVDH